LQYTNTKFFILYYILSILGMTVDMLSTKPHTHNLWSRYDVEWMLLNPGLKCEAMYWSIQGRQIKKKKQNIGQ